MNGRRMSDAELNEAFSIDPNVRLKVQRLKQVVVVCVLISCLVVVTLGSLSKTLITTTQKCKLQF